MITTAQLFVTQAHVSIDLHENPELMPLTPQEHFQAFRPSITDTEYVPAKRDRPSHRIIHFQNSKAVVVNDTPDLYRIAVASELSTNDPWSKEDPAWLFIGDQRTAGEMRQQLDRLFNHQHETKIRARG